MEVKIGTVVKDIVTFSEAGREGRSVGVTAAHAEGLGQREC